MTCADNISTLQHEKRACRVKCTLYMQGQEATKTNGTTGAGSTIQECPEESMDSSRNTKTEKNLLEKTRMKKIMKKKKMKTKSPSNEPLLTAHCPPRPKNQILTKENSFFLQWELLDDFCGVLASAWNTHNTQQNNTHQHHTKITPTTHKPHGRTTNHTHTQTNTNQTHTKTTNYKSNKNSKYGSIVS